MNVVPYDFKVARPAPGCPTFKGYWVKLFCLFDGVHLNWFAHEHDLIDNLELSHECGVTATTFVQSVLVTKDRFTSIFNEIENYVHGSHSD